MHERGAVPAVRRAAAGRLAPAPSPSSATGRSTPASVVAVGEEVTGALSTPSTTRNRSPPARRSTRCARSSLDAACRRRPSDPDLVDAVLDDLADSGSIERATTTVRLAGHRVSLDEDDADVQRLLAAVGGDAEASPPSIAELDEGARHRPRRDRGGRRRRASWFGSPRTSVFTPELVARAEGRSCGASPEGITVSAFREALGTSRKYALPLLEHFDRTGVTVRRGDLRFPR